VLIVQQTDVFTEWLSALRDRAARTRIEVRVVRLGQGNPGKIRNLGGGLSEMKIDFGPGYRVYFTQRGSELVVLLCGGDKSSQSKDIALARTLARDWFKGEDDGAEDKPV
jgi:putative addiction module killer protein